MGDASKKERQHSQRFGKPGQKDCGFRIAHLLTQTKTDMTHSRTHTQAWKANMRSVSRLLKFYFCACRLSGRQEYKRKKDRGEKKKKAQPKVRQHKCICQLGVCAAAKGLDALIGKSKSRGRVGWDVAIHKTGLFPKPIGKNTCFTAPGCVYNCQPLHEPFVPPPKTQYWSWSHGVHQPRAHSWVVKIRGGGKQTNRRTYV